MLETFNIKIPFLLEDGGLGSNKGLKLYAILSQVNDVETEMRLDKAFEICYYKIYLESLPLILIPVDFEYLQVFERIYEDIYLIPQVYRLLLVDQAKMMLINDSLCVTCLGKLLINLGINEFERMFDLLIESNWLLDQYVGHGLQVIGIPNAN